ncbi:TPA: 30S ribosomal protein S16 [bacterium]|mgnify:CR=1 FL=1|nr:30S ribosomal protein S16 [bacterium]
MSVAIRLQRFGRKKRPFYRVVISDTRNPRQGLTLDNIGYYNPLTEPAQIQINEEKAIKWLKDGAKPTDTVKNILSKTGVLQKFHNKSENVEAKEESEGEQEV